MECDEFRRDLHASPGGSHRCHHEPASDRDPERPARQPRPANRQTRGSADGRREYLLEVLEGWGTYSDVPPDVAVKRFISYMGQASVDASKLVKASPTEPVAVRERLKYLLGEAGMKVEADRIDGARSEGARRRALSVVRRSAASI